MPREIANPTISFHMGACAASDTEVWRADRHRVLRYVAGRGQRYADLARALLEEPATAWWFASLDREAQVWFPLQAFHQREDLKDYLGRRDYQQAQAILEKLAPGPSDIGTPNNPPSNFERYGQKIFPGFHKSTLMGGTSSLFVAFDQTVGDIGIGGRNPPFFPYWRLEVDASARIYEVDGPLAWHNLCLRYPADGTTRISPNPDFSYDEGRVVPNWTSFSTGWDAVHLTFGGWLTVEQVRVESPSGWDAEQTMWLRWMFTSIERMPDYHAMESPLHGLVHPVYQYRNFKPRG